MTKSTEELGQIVSQTRRDIVRMVHAVSSGHPGGSLGCAEFFTVLFQNVLRHNPGNFQMNGADEDVFILSNGHISPVYYSALAHSGYFPVKELATFRLINSRLQGHPLTSRSSHRTSFRIPPPAASTQTPLSYFRRSL